MLGRQTVGQAVLVWTFRVMGARTWEIHGRGGKAGELHIYVDTLLQTNESNVPNVFDC